MMKSVKTLMCLMVLASMSNVYAYKSVFEGSDINCDWECADGTSGNGHEDNASDCTARAAASCGEDLKTVTFVNPRNIIKDPGQISQVSVSFSSSAEISDRIYDNIRFSPLSLRYANLTVAEKALEKIALKLSKPEFTKFLLTGTIAIVKPVLTAAEIKEFQISHPYKSSHRLRQVE